MKRGIRSGLVVKEYPHSSSLKHSLQIPSFPNCLGALELCGYCPSCTRQRLSPWKNGDWNNRTDQKENQKCSSSVQEQSFFVVR
eukprot:Nitzschia sp. Nitz4//scaffold186_size43309//17567//19278//NITZ4_007319-RA/size43309-est2genome-gene-0.3-mRNA-1//-1//CDS//3329539764//2273//frame0